MDNPHIAFYSMVGTLLVIAAPVLLVKVLDSWGSSPRFNSTAGWTPAPQYHPYPIEKPPAGTPWVDYDPAIIAPHLEAEETLKGFGRGFFRPSRFTDWKYGPKLLIAATSRRILLFEIYRATVLRYCFISFEELRYVRPPKRGLWGSTGVMRIGLESGMQYQMCFYSPLFSDEAMRQERLLADSLHRLAWRYVTVRDLRTGEIERAA